MTCLQRSVCLAGLLTTLFGSFAGVAPAEGASQGEQAETGPATARVSGRMFWGQQPAPEGRPLPPAPLPVTTVILKSSGIEQRVVVKGDAPFETRLPLGTYEVDVNVPPTHRGRVLPSRLTVADALADYRLTVEVNWNGRLSGRVVNADAQPVVGVSVWLSSPDQGRGFRSFTFGISREDGTFAIDRLDPGEQRLTIGEELAPARATGRSPADAPISRTLQFQPAQHIALGEVMLPAGTAVTTVRGIVIDASGTPVKDAMVSIFEEGQRGTLAHVKTDTAGRYALAAAPDRRYSVHAIRLEGKRIEKGHSASFKAGTIASLPPIRLRTSP